MSDVKVFQMPETQYRMVDAVSSSDLKLFSKNPRALWLSKQSPTEESDDMRFGTMFHMAILEQDRFMQTYVCEPDRMPDGRLAGLGSKDTHINRNTSEWKSFIGDWRAANSGKVSVDPADYRMLLAMMTAVHSHPEARQYASAKYREVVTLWRDADTGEPCKARADSLSDDWHVDWKTTKCSTPQEFMADSYRRKYHCQLAWYEWGFSAAGFDFKDRYCMGVEKTEKNPSVFVCRMDQTLLDRGAAKMRKLLDRLHECKVRNLWPGYDGVYDWFIPPWDLVEQE